MPASQHALTTGSPNRRNGPTVLMHTTQELPAKGTNRGQVRRHNTAGVRLTSTLPAAAIPNEGSCTHRAMTSRLSGAATSATTMPGAAPPLSEAARVSSRVRSRPAMAHVLRKSGVSNRHTINQSGAPLLMHSTL